MRMNTTRSRRPLPASKGLYRGTISAGVLRVAPLMAIPELLERAGVDSCELLAEFGLSRGDFEDPENVLQFATMGRIFTRCVERTNCAHFGLRVGENVGGPVMGILGYLVQSAPTVRAALENLAAYLHVHDGGAVVSIPEDGVFAQLGYDIVVDGVESSEQILNAAMAIGFNLMRGICGPEWRLSSVQFAHAKPGNPGPLKSFFGVTPVFDAEQTALIFAATWLDRPLVSADPILHRLMVERIDELEALSSEDLLARLRRTLKQLVAAPNCSLETVALRLGIHGRTLNRLLATAGTSFREVREDVRLGAARQLLENTRKPVQQIADMLGYSDSTAFARAFRRWSGVPPSTFRASQRRALAG